MGATAFLSINGFIFGAWSRDVPSHCSFLFQEREKYCVWNDFEEIAMGYSTSVGNAQRRLSLLGFSLEQCKRKFETMVTARMEELQSQLDDVEIDEDGCTGWSSQLDSADAQLDVLKRFTFEAWTDSLRWLLENECLSKTELRQYLSDNSKEQIQSNPISDFLEVLLLDEGDYFLDSPDPRMTWGALLSTFSLSDFVDLDLTELVDADLLTTEAEVIDEGWKRLREDVVNLEPIVILTEGSSDASILQKSLSALYPEVEERFKFLDFDSTKYGGGAPSLVAQVKGFIAADVRIKILGILDNDAAGHDALRSLKGVALPSNIKVMTLPALPLAENYPAIGPLEQQTGNVNGLAVSIEFFAGEMLLKKVGDGDLVPTVWKSYMSGVNAYQGELSKKTLVAEAIRDSLSQERDSNAHQLAHPELCLLWEEIFKLSEMLS